jgi:hypothetical protein
MLELAVIVCLWGKPATLLERMPSGRAGYDALLVRRDDSQPFFVLIPKTETLEPCH